MPYNYRDTYRFKTGKKAGQHGTISSYVENKMDIKTWDLEPEGRAAQILTNCYILKGHLKDKNITEIVSWSMSLQGEIDKFNFSQWEYLIKKMAVMLLNTNLASYAMSFAKGSGDLGLTAVLHTHSLRLDYHPHIHVIVPSGAFHAKTACWHTKLGKFLFNEFSLAKVFQAKFFTLLKQSHIQCPNQLPKKWVAQCQCVGKGDSALKYLSRYLYRGVINESNIISHSNQQVSFRFKDSAKKQWKTITEPALQFLWRVLQHVLPKGFSAFHDILSSRY